MIIYNNKEWVFSLGKKAILMCHFNSLKIPLFAVAFSFVFVSCFKDVDFGQAENIKLSPDLEVDLLYYTLNENDFLDSQTNSYSPIIRDTVRLEFLNDDYIQDGLMYAEFRFRHENKFPYQIRSNIRFLDNSGQEQFNVNYDISPGSVASPAIKDTVHVMQGAEIIKVRNSIQMALEIEVLGAGKELEGELDFSSKGLFRFEF